jgi:hypothetical protein
MRSRLGLCGGRAGELDSVHLTYGWSAVLRSLHSRNRIGLLFDPAVAFFKIFTWR